MGDESSFAEPEVESTYRLQVDVLNTWMVFASTTAPLHTTSHMQDYVTLVIVVMIDGGK